jgi:hypothetical protein
MPHQDLAWDPLTILDHHSGALESDPISRPVDAPSGSGMGSTYDP